MAILVVVFSREGYKIRKVLARNQLQSNEIIEFLMGRCQKVPKCDFKSDFFDVKNHQNLSDFFFIEEYKFRNKFFVSDIF